MRDEVAGGGSREPIAAIGGVFFFAPRFARVVDGVLN